MMERRKSAEHFGKDLSHPAFGSHHSAFRSRLPHPIAGAGGTVRRRWIRPVGREQAVMAGETGFHPQKMLLIEN
jgi:hypothetical protein